MKALTEPVEASSMSTARVDDTEGAVALRDGAAAGATAPSERSPESDKEKRRT